jgi:RNA polymerase sigma factor (sigma-70 family)
MMGIRSWEVFPGLSDRRICANPSIIPASRQLIFPNNCFYLKRLSGEELLKWRRRAEHGPVLRTAVTLLHKRGRSDLKEQWFFRSPESSEERERQRTGVASLVEHLDAGFNLARYLMRNEADAEDVVQTAYTRAISHYAGFRGGEGRTWLLKIVRNCCYDRMRALAPSAQHTEFDEVVHSYATRSPDPEAALLRAERGEWVRRSLAELPPDCREVLVLRELEQLSYLEIAEITGCPLGTVMSRLSRARERMKRALSGRLESGEVGPGFQPAFSAIGSRTMQPHDRS